jgi:F-type H+-transporting ATPase subunit alpha
VKQQLARGLRLRTLLSQPQYAPLRMVDEVALALALRDGALDQVPPENVPAYRIALPAWLDEHAEAALHALDADGKMDNAQHDLVVAAVRALAQRYQGKLA